MPVAQLQKAVQLRRILVVDDTPSNVRLLQATLAAEGYEVLSASGGEEALQMLAGEEVDLVLLDVMMPRLDGFEACRAMKSDSRTRHLPVILVTSLSDLDAKVRGEQVGADDFVGKPFNKTELLVRVRSMLRMKTLHDELQHKIEELESAKAELRRLAETDPLTSLFNKRRLETFLLGELERAARYDHPLSVLMLDLDHFKRLNDTLGHPAGDRLLQQVARQIKNNLRNVDLAARYGGEEFALVLPETPNDAAADVADKLRRCVAAYSFVDEQGRRIEQSVTVSIGVATSPRDGRSTAELIGHADRRLYAAKQQGRNRVVARDP